MSYSRTDYWEECVADSLQEHGVEASLEQIKLIAKDIEGSHDNIGMAFHVPENPLIHDMKKLERKRKEERKEADENDSFWRRAYASKVGVDVSRLYVNHGEIYIGR